MKRFKKILVGLDLTAMDEILIQKTVKIAQVLEIEKIYFVHVAKNLALSEEFASSYPDVMAPQDESIEQDITKAVEKAGLPENIAFEVEAKEGNPMETVLKWARVKDVDLIIMGRKREKRGSGSLSKGTAQKSPCSVLFVSEDYEDKNFDHLMVPIDFSSYSVLSLEVAQGMTNDPDTIKCYHIYEVPAGYTKTGKTFQEFSEIMLQNAKKDYQSFIKKHGLPAYECIFIQKSDRNRAKILMKAAKNDGVDFIIIGSRGRTNSASLLIGSVAEKLISLNNKIPMLVLKEKGENMRFLEALFRV